MARYEVPGFRRRKLVNDYYRGWVWFEDRGPGQVEDSIYSWGRMWGLWRAHSCTLRTIAMEGE